MPTESDPLAGEAAAEPAKARLPMNRAFIPVLLTVCLDLVGFGIVIPLLPYFAEEYGATPAQVTWLMATYSLAQFLMAPVWGRLSDRHGRRPIMLFSTFATAVGLLAFGLAPTLGLLFLFRTLHGAATANISTAQACMADLTTPANRAMGMGLIGAAFGFGFTVGPFLGGELSRFGYHVPLLVAAGLSFLNFALAFFLLPETRKPGPSEGHQRSLSPAAFLAVARHPVVGLCVVLTFVLTSAFALMESTFTLFAKHVHGLDAVHVGRMFGVVGLSAIIIQGGLIRRLVKRYGEGPLVIAGVVILAVGLFLLPELPPTLPMLGSFLVISVGQSITNPSLNALISQGTAPSEQGFVLGTNQSMSAIARVIGPTLGGFLYAGVGPRAPFFVAGGVLVLSLFLVRAALRQRTAGDLAV
jgi:DHA1 family tetracycline resistance protein-like MFS transporter